MPAKIAPVILSWKHIKAAKIKSKTRLIWITNQAEFII